MNFVINLASTFALLLGLAWAFLPGQFGLMNFKKSHSAPLGLFATVFWLVLMLIHPLAFYQIWFAFAPVIWWLLIPFLTHIVFFTTIGKTVSTR
jgi:hypothetical protein